MNKPRFMVFLLCSIELLIGVIYVIFFIYLFNHSSAPEKLSIQKTSVEQYKVNTVKRPTVQYKNSDFTL